MRQSPEVFPKFPHFLRVRGPRILIFTLGPCHSTSPAYLAALVRSLRCLAPEENAKLVLPGDASRRCFRVWQLGSTVDTVHTSVAEALEVYTFFHVKVAVGS